MDQNTLQAARPAIGLVQGLVLLALYRASSLQVWPATDGLIFAPLVTTAVFIPLVAISGLGNIRTRTLALWLIVATILCAGLTFYDIFRDPNDLSRFSDIYPSGAPRSIGSFKLWLSLAALLFIAHALVLASEADQRVIATYPSYFDVSWKHGIQAKLAALFVGVFWAILFLGGALFALIKINLLDNLIKEDFFWIPVTALAAGYALHLTDSRAGLTRGARTLALFLLSWLLPVMTLLAIGFVAALPFTGLEVLWSTRHAAASLLGAAAMLIFLINAAYQDGNAELVAPLRIARLAASLVLLPLTALAGYALALRVEQYGWSPDRVIAAACVIVSVCYAIGYLYAAAWFGLRLRGLEPVNIGTAFAVIVILLALLTPLADPARISVDSQLARLTTGKVPPDKFDFVFLKFDAGRYGRAALTRLAALTGDDTQRTIAQRATAMLAQKQRYVAVQAQRAPATPEQRAARITVVYPSGATLPDSFLRQSGVDRTDGVVCLTGLGECDAVLVDLDGDGKDEIILMAKPSGTATAFRADGDDWKSLGILGNSYCGGVREGLREGKFELKDAPFKEILVNGTRLRINSSAGCGRAR